MNNIIVYENGSYIETCILDESHAEDTQVQGHVRVIECSDNSIIKLYRVEWMTTKDHRWQHKAVYTPVDALKVFYQHIGMDTLLYDLANTVIDYKHASEDGSLIDALQSMNLLSGELLHRYRKMNVK